MRHRPIVAIFACEAVLAATAVAGSPPCHEAKLVAAGGTSNDWNGNVVAIDGDTAITGAPNASNGTVDSGAAYVFVRVDGQWTEQQMLTPPEEEAAVGEAFGWSVSIDGDTAVVGCVSDSEAGTQAGAAYVYTRSDGVWSLQQKLIGSEVLAHDAFGGSVDVQGDVLAVGAPRAGYNERGHAYFYHREAGTWVEEQWIEETGLTSRFGSSVAVSGATVAVGAPGKEGPHLNRGATMIFVRNGGLWSMQAEIPGPFDEGNQYFGWAVDLEADRLIVGATCTGCGSSFFGDAHVYDRAGAVWSWTAQLNPSPAGEDDTPDGFGWSVAIEGDSAFVGAAYPDSGAAETVYVFERNGGAWVESYQITPPADESGHKAFGISVSASGSTLLVSGRRDDDVASDAGAAYVVDMTGNCSADCVADLSSDGVVGVADMLVLLAAWGTEPGGPPDFDGGGVGVTDLLFLLIHWGPC